MTLEFNDRLNNCLSEEAILGAVYLSILADIPSWLGNIQYNQEVTHLLLKIQYIVGTEGGWITHSNWSVIG